MNDIVTKTLARAAEYDGVDIRDNLPETSGWTSHNGKGLPSVIKDMPAGTRIKTLRRIFVGNKRLDDFCYTVGGDEESWTWGPRFMWDTNDFNIMAYQL